LAQAILAQAFLVLRYGTHRVWDCDGSLS